MMKSALLIFLVLFALFLYNSQPATNKKQSSVVHVVTLNDSVQTRSYEEIKSEIADQRKQFEARYSSADTLAKKEIIKEINHYWVKAIANDLYSKWKDTPWDFNGTTTQPQQGSIACGYFVTTILQHMDLKINRVKLAICASSQMMKSLTPKQRLKNLSYLDYTGFNNKLKEYGKGVYVIGLDFHTGFIIHDGSEVWFLHSNYIDRKGVIKETVLHSAALKASKTRWLVTLTNDTDFLQNWLKG